MAYANISSATKKHRASQIITDIGSGGFMKFYTGVMPPSPDVAPSGSLLVALPLSSPAGTVSLAVLSGFVTVPGTGGTDGTYALTITPAMADPGTGATGLYTVSGGVLTGIQISSNGSGYAAPPTFSGFTMAGLTAAAASPVMTGILVFGAIGTASGTATGTTGYVRIATSGNVGVLDLDAGTTNGFSVIMNNTFIVTSGAVTCTVDILIEG
jgi:hypothetical protein